MASHLMLRCAFKFHDDTPKNLAVITPHFRRQLDITDPTSGVNATQLCQDLADALALALPGATTPFTVTAYNDQGVKPNYPMASITKNSGAAIKVVSCVPEAAVCLSFYADQNRPRHRGRLYLPAWLLGGTSGDMGRVVPSGLRTTAQACVTSFANLGGANVDWGVWSGVDRAFYKATNYFISDAWAIQRRRGIKETARTVGTTSG